MNNRKVIFVRHSFDPDIVKYLWERRAIAVRYQNIASINPEDYEKKFARDAISRLRSYCTEGVIVGASYRSHQPARLLVGVIGPGSPEELIRVEQINGYFHKVVQLQKPERVSYRDYPILAIQPTHGTISEWKKVGKHLRAIYQGEALEWAATSLTPAQLEVLCYEYLRTTGQLDALVMPIGRGLPDIDIYGIRADDCEVIAQVTHADDKKVAQKHERLREYDGVNTDLVFFGPFDKRISQDPDIRYIPIEDVFAFLTQVPDSVQYKMIEHMLGTRR
jgi:hypothetical protein